MIICLIFLFCQAKACRDRDCYSRLYNLDPGDLMLPQRFIPEDSSPDPHRAEL